MSNSSSAAPCAYCGGASTHFCAGCGKMVCNSPRCNAAAAMAAGRRAVGAVKSTITRAYDSAVDALNLKP